MMKAFRKTPRRTIGNIIESVAAAGKPLIVALKPSVMHRVELFIFVCYSICKRGELKLPSRKMPISDQIRLQ